jgi:integrase
MLDDMRLAGFAQRTRDVYIQAVRRLAAHYKRSPDQLSEEEVRKVEVGDIESARGLLRVFGKGDKERRVPLPDAMLADLRRLWPTHRSTRWVSLLQGRPPRACAQALPQAGARTVNRRGDCQRSRLGVPAAPRLSIAYSSPILAPQARIYRPAVSTMHRNPPAPHHCAAGRAMASRLQPITSPSAGLENP